MRTVFKYALAGPSTILWIPSEAKVIAVQLQDGQPCAWVELDDDADHYHKVILHAVGTGREVPPGARYVATFQVERLVWHVYEERP